MTPEIWQRAESAIVAAAVVIAAIHLDFAWWWLLALFLAFDLSMVGYARDTRTGAHLYNAVHNYAPPAVLTAVYLLTDTRWLVLVALAWAFHVAVDRALGYGLKHGDHFQHTHLGWLKGKPGTNAEANPAPDAGDSARG